MRFVYSAQIGLLLLLPVALIGCGSSPAPTETASTDTTTTADNSTTDNSTTDASKSDAKVIDVGDSGVQVSAPAGWTNQSDPGGTTLKSADGNVSVDFLPATDTNARLENVKGNLKKIFETVKDDGPATATKVGALDSSQQTGTAEGKGAKVSWTLDTVKNKIIIESMIQDQTSDADMAEYKTVMDSIKDKS